MGPFEALRRLLAAQGPRPPVFEPPEAEYLNTFFTTSFGTFLRRGATPFFRFFRNSASLLRNRRSKPNYIFLLKILQKNCSMISIVRYLYTNDHCSHPAVL
jgi:hypothetical protein